MPTLRKTIPYSLLVVLVALLTIACSCNEQTETDQTTSAADSLTAPAPDDSLIIEMQGADSQTVFEILQATHKIEFVSTATGVFVKSIDSIENSSSCFWIYSVNDSMAQVAADEYTTAKGDIIKWHFRKMTP